MPQDERAIALALSSMAGIARGVGWEKAGVHTNEAGEVDAMIVAVDIPTIMRFATELANEQNVTEASRETQLEALRELFPALDMKEEEWN